MTQPTTQQPQDVEPDYCIINGERHFNGSRRDWCEDHGEDYDRLNAEEDDSGEGEFDA